MSKSKKKSSVSLTKIRTALKEAVFNPRKPGPMQIVADQGSPEYYELRAIEEIHAARVIRQSITFKTHDPEEPQYHQHINKAIQLLILARLNV